MELPGYSARYARDIDAATRAYLDAQPVRADDVRDYGTAERYLSQGRNGAATQDRPVPTGHHTRIVRVGSTLGNLSERVANGRDGGTGQVIALRLWDTNVLTWSAPTRTRKAGTVALDSGGWRTVTTKARINEHLPQGWTLYSDRGRWVLANRYSDTRVPFFDGLTLDIAAEKVTNAPSAAKVEQARKAEAAMLARINRYADAYMAAMARPRGISAPNGGDCWYCAFFDRSQDSAPSTMPTGDASHLAEHMRERYYVPSLMVNALRAKGYRPEFVALHVGLTEDGARMLSSRSILGAATLRRVLVRYMKARLVPTVAR